MTDPAITLSLVALFISVVSIALNLMDADTVFDIIDFIKRLPDWMVLFGTILFWACLMFFLMWLVILIQGVL